jgi:hypothetical protein
MDRRSLLKGLIAAPFVITTPGLLMPVKAVPKPFAYVRGVWLNGETFVKEINEPMGAAFVSRFAWFDDVASITSYEYTDTNPETNPYIAPAAVFSAFSRKSGEPMLTPMQRAEYSPLRGNIKYEDWELKAFADIDKLYQNSSSIDGNGDSVCKFNGEWHKDPQSLLNKQRAEWSKDPTKYLLNSAIK